MQDAGQCLMPNRVRVVTVTDADRVKLERMARDRGAPARVSERARIVLLSADGLTGPQIAERVGCSEPTVVKWRARYAAAGLAGLADAPRPGGPRTVLTDEVIAVILSATVTPPPGALAELGVTHWSARRLADWLARTRKIQVSHDSIVRLWRRFCLQPHRTDGFKFSTDPQLEAKVRDVVGLYLRPPENAVVVCVDEKTQCQALERSQPILPMRPGIPERQTHDYARHGVTSLFAALNTATGTVTDACYPRPGTARHLRQLRHPQARRGQDMAGEEPAGHAALHADRMLVDQHGRVLLLGDHPSGHPPRLLHLSQGAHGGHRRVHRSLERPPRPVYLDQGPRGNTRRHQTRED